MGSAEKGNYQPWRHEMFMSDRKVRRMIPTALKTYMMLLHEAFVCSTRPNLPDDESELELMAFCTDHDEWMSVREIVLGMFTKETVDNIPVLVNKRLNIDWGTLQDIREEKSKAGKAGAAKRWANRNSKNSTPIADPCDCITEDSMYVSNVCMNERNEIQEAILEDGQDMKLKDEIQIICVRHGLKAGGYASTWSDLKNLTIAFSTGYVLRDFEEWLEENSKDDFRNGPVSAYLYVAHDRLSADSSPATAVLKDPEGVSLSRELSYLSDGVVAFVDKQKIRLAEVLKEFTAEEVTTVFKQWLDEQDLTDPKNVQFLPGKFVQLADSRAYALRRSRAEKSKAETERASTVLRLQEQAESERIAAQKLHDAEELLFDPLS